MKKLAVILFFVAAGFAFAQLDPVESMKPLASPAELFTKAQTSYIEHDYVQAAALFHKAADLGHPEAQYMYALMLYRGEGTPTGIPNYEQAAHYYSLSASQGFAKAQYNLSVLYYQGNGVARDDIASYKWLYLASVQKEPRALKMLPVADRNLTTDQKSQALADAGKISSDIKIR